jgi:hypothetical protein
MCSPANRSSQAVFSDANRQSTPSFRSLTAIRIFEGDLGWALMLAVALFAGPVVFGQAVPVTVVSTNGTTALDLNGDETTDVVVQSKSSSTTTPDGYQYGGWLDVVATQGVSFLAGSPFLVGTNAPVASGASTWTTNVTRITEYSISFPFGGYISCSDGLIGVRIHSPDGYHYGWIKMAATSLTNFPFCFIQPDQTAINPWPGEALQLGAAARGPLRVDVAAAGKINITWPATFGGVLQSKSLEPGSVWAPVTVSTPGVYTTDTSAGGVIFRLQ